MVKLARALIGLMKDRHGTYYAHVKVPDRLQEAVARVLNQGKDRQQLNWSRRPPTGILESLGFHFAWLELE